jgi:hypothetical protein
MKSMSWLDDRIQQDREREESVRSISNDAPNLYVSLWSAIVEVVEEAKSKQIPISTNGTEIDRIVSLSVKPRPDESHRSPKQIHLKLAKDNLSINVSGDISVIFSIDVCPDMIVCLKENGKQVSLRDAAKRVLDQFLFPHLYSPTA